MVGDDIDSAIIRRNTISKLVLQGAIDGRIVAQLLRNGFAISDEAVLWDFKRELPSAPQAKLNPAGQAAYDAKISEIIKDSVAFHNTFGGYVIAGIDDASREVVGFDKPFDAPDLNKRIQGATGYSIEPIYRLLNILLTALSGLLDCYSSRSELKMSARRSLKRLRRSMTPERPLTSERYLL